MSRNGDPRAAEDTKLTAMRDQRMEPRVRAAVVPGPVRAVVVALLVSVLVAAAGAGCSSSPARLDLVRSERQIAADLSKTYRVPVSDVRCPSKVVVKRGSSFPCTVDVGRPPQLLTVKVEQRNDKGALLVRPQAAVLQTDQIAAEMATRLKEQFNRAFLADCGAPAVKVLPPGSQLDCRAADGTSQRVITATVHDIHGTLTFAVQDPAPPASTAPGATVPDTTVPDTAVPDTTVPDTGQKLTPVAPVAPFTPTTNP